MDIQLFPSSKTLESPFIDSIFSYIFQNTLITLLLLAFFGLLILHEPISHLFIKHKKTEQEKFETKYFWQTLVMIPLVSVPFLWMMLRFGVFEIYVNPQTSWVILVQFAAMIVLHDAYFYWCHRLLHTKHFWNIHGIHHQDVDPTIVTSHIFHFVETCINYTFILWFTLLAGTMFGGVFFLPVAIFIVFTLVWNIYGHGKNNLVPRTVTESWIGRFIVWPSYHLEHHRQGKGNFGCLFTWWDRAMNTRLDM